MPTCSPKSATKLSVDSRDASHKALAAMLPHVYEELHAIADRALRYDRQNKLLEPAALVNEVFLRLARQRNVGWRHRPHFVGIAVRFMRRVLIDHARRRQAAKRRSNRQRVSLDEAALCSKTCDREVVALEDALVSLAAFDTRKSRIVELRYIGGLTVEQCAEHLGISPATVKREWAVARNWLRREITGD